MGDPYQEGSGEVDPAPGRKSKPRARAPGVLAFASRAAEPGAATGRDMHARLAHNDPPLEIALRRRKPRLQRRMSVSMALASGVTTGE